MDIKIIFYNAWKRMAEKNVCNFGVYITGHKSLFFCVCMKTSEKINENGKRLKSPFEFPFLTSLLSLVLPATVCICIKSILLLARSFFLEIQMVHNPPCSELDKAQVCGIYY